MSPIGWVAVGAGGVCVLGLVVILAVDRDARSAAGQFLLALVSAPLAVWLVLLRRAPRAHRLSPEALELFARQRKADGGRAWAFTYRNRGVILLRRAGERHGWRNDAPARMNDSVKFTARSGGSW